MSSTTQTTKKDLSKNREALINKLDGQWKSDDKHITAIKDIENHKGVKYGDEILEKYEDNENTIKPSTFISGHPDYEMYSTSIKAEYIDLMNDIRKMTESNKTKIFTGRILPVIVVFFKDSEYRGALCIAPKI